MKLGYVVLHYTFDDLTNACLASLARYARLAPVLVVDNGSPAPFVAEVPVLRLPENLCLAAAMNAGTCDLLAATDVDGVVQLNDNVVVTSNTHSQLTWVFAVQGRLGIAAPLMDQPDAGFMYHPCPYPPGDQAEAYLQDTLPPCESQLVPFVDNAAWAIRRATWEQVGPLEERFSSASWGANYDYCWRARLHGWETGLVRSAFVFHRHRATWSHLDPNYAERHAAMMMEEMRLVWGDMAGHSELPGVGAPRAHPHAGPSSRRVVVVIDDELQALLHREETGYLNAVDLIAASNAPAWDVRSNEHWGVGQFRSAEGYPNRRPYAGTENFDAIELLAIRRARDLFGSEHANVQPLSGSLANLAAYRAVMRPGDTLLSMAMQSGGHLSHGHPRHLVSESYRVVHYSVNPANGLLDYDLLRETALRERPRLIVAGYSSYPRRIDFRAFASIAAEVEAYLLADISHIAGLVAAGMHPNPCRVGAIVSSSVEKTLRGTRGGFLLCRTELAQHVDTAVFPGLQSSVGLGGLISLCSILREAATPEFERYQQQTVANARLLGCLLAEFGLPLLTGGTDTHMLILDVSTIGLSGREAEKRLEGVAILSNRNMIPSDPRPPFEASGLRLGTPTITARGFVETDVRELGGIIGDVLRAPTWSAEVAAHHAARVRELVMRERAGDTLADLRLRSAALGTNKGGMQL